MRPHLKQNEFPEPMLSLLPPRMQSARDVPTVTRYYGLGIPRNPWLWLYYDIQLSKLLDSRPRLRCPGGDSGIYIALPGVQDSRSAHSGVRLSTLGQGLPKEKPTRAISHHQRDSKNCGYEITLPQFRKGGLGKWETVRKTRNINEKKQRQHKSVATLSFLHKAVRRWS
jgi:hypothetical protein